MSAPLTAADLEACFIPDSLQELVRVVGAEGALRLVAGFGGLTLALPTRLKPDGDLVRLLGWETAEALVAWGGGDRIYIPRAERALRCLRDQEIRRRVDAREPVADLARQYRLSERRIWAILKMPDPIHAKNTLPNTATPRQLSLF
ncbi:MAG: hypothetical protein HQL98_15530 [Magnetococcales bacterium]|nr:hypothetical protein [Magnetococcales bacterium]